MKKYLLFMITLLLLSACEGIDKEKAKAEFKAELDKISNPLNRQQVISEIYKLCGDFEYIEINSSKDEAREFRSKLKMTPSQEKGTKAVCPRYW